MKALTKHIANRIATGQESLLHQEAVRQAFRESMSERIAPMIKAAADLQRKEGLPHYLDCYAAHTAAQVTTGVDETFRDGIKAAGSAIGSVAAGAVADGTGVNIKKLGAVVKAFRRRKPKFQTTKVPRAAKKRKSSEPAPTAVRMTRQDFAASLKAAGGDLRKVKS
jgi:lipoate-protein ligase A